MRSKYGNIIADALTLVFSIFSVGLVLISCVKEDYILFGISSMVYILPKILDCAIYLETNSINKIAFRIDLTVMACLLVSLILNCLIIVAYFTGFSLISESTVKIFEDIYFVLVVISMINVIYQLITGIRQKLSLIKSKNQ